SAHDVLHHPLDAEEGLDHGPPDLLDRPRARPQEPRRPFFALLILPLDADARTETRPNPEGRCFPTPAPAPRVREEKMVGRATGRYAAPRETSAGGAGSPARVEPSGRRTLWRGAYQP